MKNKFLKSTLILLLGGGITKVIGLFIKVIYTRIIGIEGISLYALISPTYSLLISLANANILVSISKRISSENNTKKVMINSCYIMFVLDILLMFCLFLSARFISFKLLKNADTFYPLLACGLTLPFISLGYIIKGYFYGRQNVAPHMLSNVLEQLFRLLLISFILPKVICFGVVITIVVLILFNILSESFSILILLLFLPRNISIKKEDLKFDYKESKEILSISLPSVSGRLIGNIGFFFEPILLTAILLKMGCGLEYINTEYGIYNAYVISTLLFPSFFITAISNSLLPEISNFFAKRDYKTMKLRIKQALKISLIVGVVCTILIFNLAEIILDFLYKTDKGIKYIKVLAPFFILFYLEAPLNSILTGMNKVKSCTFISVTGIFIKLIMIIIFGLLNFKIYSLVLAEIFNIMYVTVGNIIILKKELVSSS